MSHAEPARQHYTMTFAVLALGGAAFALLQSLVAPSLGVGGGMGIVLAGPIVEHLSYHWLFWMPLVVVVAAAGLTHFFVPESPIKTPGQVNWAGAGLLSAWLVCLLLGISEGPSWGWGSLRIVALLVA